MFTCTPCSAHLRDELHDKSCPFCGEQFGPPPAKSARTRTASGKMSGTDAVLLTLAGGFVTIILFCWCINSLLGPAFNSV